MKRRHQLPILPAALLLALAPLGASAAEVAGRVMNGTTGQAVAGQFVNLLALRGQMVPIRETQTNAEGRYSFVVDANPSERFLVQVPFQGVNYNQPAMFSSGERITADIQVFEAGARPEDISLEAQTFFLEPHSGHVRVSEFYAVHNHSRPPRTFNPDEGSFRFAVPGPVGDLQVSAARAGSVPLRQQPQEIEAKNTYVINYAFQPGEAEIQVSYALPMSGNTLDLRLPLLLPAKRRHVAVPKAGVRLTGSGLKEIQQEQVPTASVFALEAGAAREARLRLEVDPEALAAAEASSVTQAPQAAAEESQVQIVPHPVNQAQWYIAGLTLFVLLLGLYYLYSLRPPAQESPASGTSDAARRQSDRPAAD